MQDSTSSPQHISMRSFQDGAFHLALGPEAEDVDPEKECYPAGQGSGAIQELVPAGELVRRFVEEAEQAIAAASKYL